MNGQTKPLDKIRIRGCLLVLFLLAAATVVFADGMTFSGNDLSYFIPITEENQHAIIAHKDGQEAMLLAVNIFLKDNEKAFWLFPVPAKPADIKTDVTDQFPTIRGWQPTFNARTVFDLLLAAQVMSQPYVWPLTCIMSSFGTAGTNLTDLSVHSVTEKFGLKIETLTAISIDSLEQHLKESGIQIDPSHLTAFSEYLTDKYSLIFVRISSKEELIRQLSDYKDIHKEEEGRWPAVFVTFPSEQIFFPLKPTGSYRDEIQIIVKVLDFVKNKGKLNDGWSYNYYRQTNTDEPLPDVLQPYITEKPLRYTNFRFYGNAADLKEDMWMVPFEPVGIKYAYMIDKFAKLGGGSVMILGSVLLFLFQSWLCAGSAGLLFYRKWNPYALFGLWNILTLLAVYVASKPRKIVPLAELQNADVEIKSFRLYLRRPNPQETKRTFFLLTFSLLFIASSILLYVLFTLPLRTGS